MVYKGNYVFGLALTGALATVGCTQQTIDGVKVTSMVPYTLVGSSPGTISGYRITIKGDTRNIDFLNWHCDEKCRTLLKMAIETGKSVDIVVREGPFGGLDGLVIKEN